MNIKFGQLSKNSTTGSTANTILDNFLDNGKNAPALAAARMISQPNPPAHMGNPILLIFCGEPGSGKTHLLKGIQQKLEGCSPDKPPLLARAKVFLETDPAANNLWSGEIWKSCSAILLDDIDELMENAILQDKLSQAIAQTEFLLPPNQPVRLIFGYGGTASFKQFVPSLASRLHQGLILQLSLPDLSVRVKYLEKIAVIAKLDLKKEMLLFLARQSPHLPVLQGLIKKIAFFNSLYNKLPTEIELEKLLEGHNPANNLNWHNILKKVSEKMNVPTEKLLENNRKAEIALARQICMYMCRQKLGLSFQEIGKIFGGKDHSTVIHSIKKIIRIKDTDKVVHKLLTELEKETF